MEGQCWKTASVCAISGRPPSDTQSLSPPPMRRLCPAARIRAPTLAFLDDDAVSSEGAVTVLAVPLWLGEDHPPRYRLQNPRNDNLYLLVQIAAASFHHHHRAVVQKAHALPDLLALLDDTGRHLLSGP